MIRFCKKIVREIDIIDLYAEKNREFFQQYKEEGVIVVKEFKQIKGIVTYRNYFENDRDIQEEKVFIGEQMWERAHKLFNKNKEISILPVIDNNEILCFCYDNKKKSYKYYEIDEILSYYEEQKGLFSFLDLYPKVKQIIIYGFNEWGYRLYKIFRKKQMRITVYGDLWAYFDVCSDIITVTDYEVFSIYAEGASTFYESDISQNFSFLNKLASVNKLLLEYQLKKKYCKTVENFYICQIPLFQELKNVSIDEKIRYKLKIKPAYDKQHFDEIYVDQFIKVAEVTPEEYLKQKEVDNIKFNSLTISINGISALKLGEGKNYIYLIGPCIVSCAGVLVDDSLMFHVYNNICQEGLDYSVVAIPCEVWNGRYLQKCFNNLCLRKNDFIFLIERNINIMSDKLIPDINLLEIYNTRRKNETWFYDEPIHSNKRANQAIAQRIFGCIKEKLPFMGQDYIVQQGEILDSSSREKMNEFIYKLKQQLTDVPENSLIGSIVMNCNPFTLGHRYLIEYAARNVDYLYIFVLEEDVSFFTFAERFHLVKKGTEDIKNVKVFPSGHFMISMHTFPSYFRKESYQDIYADACHDVEIFARYLVPNLNIKFRFIGEELLDETTRKYNQILHSTLEKIGVTVCEIPRIQIGNGVVSASRVRECYQKNDWAGVKNMVSDYTYTFLRKKKNLLE